MGGTTTLAVTGTTDPDTAVSVALSPSAGGSPLTTTSTGSGAWTVTTTGVPVGDYTITATAGVTPDTTVSAAVTAHVIGAVFPGNQAHDPGPMELAANWLAGTITDFSQAPVLTFDDAMCRYLNSSLANGGVIAALNKWAGITDPQLYVSQNDALNRVAALNGVPGIPNLDDATALWRICQKLYP
jgi:hypothetical protein